MATEPFRITPNLGPDLTQTQKDYYWKDLSPDAADGGISYQLGSKVVGNDGHEYVHVTAAADLDADARVNIDDATWVATENGTGTHMAPVAVASGDAFHARKFTL